MELDWDFFPAFGAKVSGLKAENRFPPAKNVEIFNFSPPTNPNFRTKVPRLEANFLIKTSENFSASAAPVVPCKKTFFHSVNKSLGMSLNENYWEFPFNFGDEARPELYANYDTHSGLGGGEDGEWWGATRKRFQ